MTRGTNWSAADRPAAPPLAGLLHKRQQLHHPLVELCETAWYESNTALIAQPASVAHGSEQGRAALQGLALKGRITPDTKLVVTVGDLAYLSNTWSLSGTGPDGKPVALGATTVEVTRRQPDGTWRYVIDNAWGDQAVAG
jgi:ketosteroid isomerase-like protein